MNGPESGLLVEDIDEHGLREPILLHQGLALDGRDRLRACEIAGVAPRFIEWDGAGVYAFSQSASPKHPREPRD